ncbi:hypothetical protein ACS0TY_027983 [Phlomoides rotata]
MNDVFNDYASYITGESERPAFTNVNFPSALNNNVPTSNANDDEEFTRGVDDIPCDAFGPNEPLNSKPDDDEGYLDEDHPFDDHAQTTGHVDVFNQYNYEVSYHMVWISIKRAVENVYGAWETSYQYLPKFMSALQGYNPGTIVEWRHADHNPATGVFTLGYVFWAFKLCIDAFQHCRKVITVDGTHLYTKYKHKLLIAITIYANQQIIPLAFAIVDEETIPAWR